MALLGSDKHLTHGRLVRIFTSNAGVFDVYSGSNADRDKGQKAQAGRLTPVRNTALTSCYRHAAWIPPRERADWCEIIAARIHNAAYAGTNVSNVLIPVYWRNCARCRPKPGELSRCRDGKVHVCIYILSFTHNRSFDAPELLV